VMHGCCRDAQGQLGLSYQQMYQQVFGDVEEAVTMSDAQYKRLKQLAVHNGDNLKDGMIKGSCFWWLRFTSTAGTQYKVSSLCSLVLLPSCHKVSACVSKSPACWMLLGAANVRSSGCVVTSVHHYVAL
jgi:hypothetical protein